MINVVPDDWKLLVRQHVLNTCGEDRDYLSARDFPIQQSVHLKFDDGSHATFRYAFAVEDKARNLLLVVTEHCGYHVFHGSTSWKIRKR